jgi:hypothetical protein
LCGLVELFDVHRSGRPQTHDYKEVALNVLKTLGEKPPYGASVWTAKAISQKLGLPDDTVGKILRAASIRLGPVRSWWVGNDPLLYEKAAEVISQYMDSPESTVVKALDEKTCIQAIEREAGAGSAPAAEVSPGP